MKNNFCKKKMFFVCKFCKILLNNSRGSLVVGTLVRSWKNDIKLLFTCNAKSILMIMTICRPKCAPT